MRVPVGHGRLQADRGQELGHPVALGGVRALALDHEGLGQDLAHLHARVEGRVRVLEHHLTVPALLARRPVALGRDDLAVEDDRAVRRALQADDHPADRRLAAARLADQAEGLALVDREARVGHRADRPDLVADEPGLDRELLDQVLDAQQLAPLGARRDDRLVGAHHHRLGPANRVVAGVGAVARDGERRLLGPAAVRRVFAARSESAADDPLGEVRRQAGDRAELVLGGVLQVRHRGQQRLGVGVAHVVEERVGLGLLGLLPGVHHDHPVGATGDDAHVVGDQEDAHVELLAQRVDNVEDLGLDRHVQRRRGLVGDQQFGPADQAHRDDDALSQAAREFERVLVEPLGRARHLDHLEDLEGAGPGLLLGGALVDLEALADLAADLHRRVERAHRVLGDQRDRAAPVRLHLALGQVGEFDAVQDDRPALDVAVVGQQPHDRQPGRGLAAARLAHQPDALARLDAQREVVDRGDE